MEQVTNLTKLKIQYVSLDCTIDSTKKLLHSYKCSMAIWVSAKSTQILNLSFNQWEKKHVYIVIKQHASTQEGQYTYNRKGQMKDIKV